MKVVTSTTASAYLATDPKNMAYQPGAKKGSFALYAAVSETYQGKTGKVYVFNTHYFLANNFLTSNAAYANSEVFTKALGELCEMETNLSIPSTSSYEEALRMTTHQKNVLLIILVGVIPGVILLAGIVMVFLRRK